MKRGWHYGRWEQSSKVEELEIGLGHRVCEELGAALDKAVVMFPPRRDAKGMTLAEVGKVLRMSSESVRRVEAKALRKLRSRLQNMGCWSSGDVE